MITVMPQPEDIVAAIRIKRRRLFTGKMGILVWGGHASGVLIGLLVAFVGPGYGIPAEYGYWILGLYVAMWVLLGINDFLLLPLLAQRVYKKAAPERLKSTLEWDEQGLTTENHLKQRNSTLWQEFSHWYQNDGVFMLFLKSGRYKVFPKRSFDQAALADFQRHLETKIGPAS